MALDHLPQAGVRARMQEFDDPDAAEAELWPGVVHGVRAFVVENLAKIAKLN